MNCSLVFSNKHYLSPIEIFTSPVKYGWEFLNGLIVLITTDNLPALLTLIEMSSCECKKECLSKRCKSFKKQSYLHWLM